MDLDLSESELRVLAALIEKERATPDNYPLTTNALVSACNQKTSRDPVTSLTEADVDAAMLSLRDRGLARSLRPTGSRSWKHRHVVPEAIPLDDAELAVVAVLALRSAQTSGELRTRTERLHPFDSVEEVESTLEQLARRDPPLVCNIGRGPGQSQDRWVQLLGDTGERPTVTSTGVHSPATTIPSGGPQRTAEFRRLHEAGLFIMPNPWDRGSARLLEGKGFPALATTSAGFGRAIGKDDQEVTRDELVAHVADLTSFIGVPLNVDSERLFPEEPGGIHETVRLLAKAGASGVSIEDYNPATRSIDPIGPAVDAVDEAVAACAAHDVVLTARAENHLYGQVDLDDTVARLAAFRDAGADVLYAPGLSDLDEIELVVASVEHPVNVLAWPTGPAVDELRSVGVRRISIGGAMFNAAAATVAAAADELLTSGTSSYIKR